MKFKFINKKKNSRDDEQLKDESTPVKENFDDIKLDDDSQDYQQRPTNDLYRQNLDFLLENDEKEDYTEQQDEDILIEQPNNIPQISDEEREKWFNNELEAQITKEIEWDEHQKTLDAHEQKHNESQPTHTHNSFPQTHTHLEFENHPTSEKEAKAEAKKKID